MLKLFSMTLFELFGAFSAQLTLLNRVSRLGRLRPERAYEHRAAEYRDFFLCGVESGGGPTGTGFCHTRSWPNQP
jgi:hypothetical protein